MSEYHPLHGLPEDWQARMPLFDPSEELLHNMRYSIEKWGASTQNFMRHGLAFIGTLHNCQVLEVEIAYGQDIPKAGIEYRPNHGSGDLAWVRGRCVYHGETEGAFVWAREHYKGRTGAHVWDWMDTP